jgi:hypothetical protein
VNYCLSQAIQFFIKSKFPKVNPTPTIKALPMGQGRFTFANISKTTIKHPNFETSNPTPKRMPTFGFLA